MADGAILVDRPVEHVLLVTINRPEKRNSINGAVAAGIDAAVKQAESDPSIRAVVLTGAGDQSFCAGADLAEVAAGRHAALITADGGFAGIIEAKRTKPWIAAVDALAVGGGTEICLSLDLIVASERARFGLPEVKLGIIAGGAGVFRIAQRIPPAIATEMLVTGDSMTAARAYEVGLVNSVVAPGEAVTAAIALAAKIAANAPIAVQQSLRVARQARYLSEELLFAEMRAAGKVVRESEDAKEGPRAFVEKRKPVWSGR